MVTHRKNRKIESSIKSWIGFQPSTEGLPDWPWTEGLLDPLPYLVLDGLELCDNGCRNRDHTHHCQPKINMIVNVILNKLKFTNARYILRRHQSQLFKMDQNSKNQPISPANIKRNNSRLKHFHGVQFM